MQVSLLIIIINHLGCVSGVSELMRTCLSDPIMKVFCDDPSQGETKMKI